MRCSWLNQSSERNEQSQPNHERQRAPNASRLEFPSQPDSGETPKGHCPDGHIHAEAPRVFERVRLIVAAPAMQAFKNGRSAELFTFDGDFALRRIKGEAPLWHRVLPLNDERSAVSAATDGMRAIHAEVVQNLLRDRVACHVGREGARVMQF